MVFVQLDEDFHDVQPSRAIGQANVHNAGVGYAILINESHGQVFNAGPVIAPRRDGLHVFEDEHIGGLRRMAVVEGIVAGVSGTLVHIEAGGDYACKVDR